MSSRHIFLAGAAQSEAFLHPEHIPQISLRCLLIKRTISCRATSSGCPWKKTKIQTPDPRAGVPHNEVPAHLYSLPPVPPHPGVPGRDGDPDPAPLSGHLLEGPACRVLCASWTSPDCWSPLGRVAQLSLGATPALVTEQ